MLVIVCLQVPRGFCGAKLLLFSDICNFFCILSLQNCKIKVRLFDNSIFRGFDFQFFEVSRNRGFEKDLLSPEVGGNLAPQGGFPFANRRGPGVLT